MKRIALSAVGKYLPVVLFVGALIVYAFGVKHSVLFNDRAAQQQTIITKNARLNLVEMAREKILAEAYWQRYPDVAADDFFGREGALGVHGPREHFDRHGRTEGRVWTP